MHDERSVDDALIVTVVSLNWTFAAYVMQLSDSSNAWRTMATFAYANTA